MGRAARAPDTFHGIGGLRACEQTEKSGGIFASILTMTGMSSGQNGMNNAVTSSSPMIVYTWQQHMSSQGMEHPTGAL